MNWMSQKPALWIAGTLCSAMGTSRAFIFVCDGRSPAIRAANASISAEADPGLTDQSRFKGLHPPRFYLVELRVANAEEQLKPGMTGVARIYGKRESLGGMMWENLRVMLGRKIW